MKAKETIGCPEFIDFQRADGKFEKRLLWPVLDEFGGWLHWVDQIGAAEHQAARGLCGAAEHAGWARFAMKKLGTATLKVEGYSEVALIEAVVSRLEESIVEKAREMAIARIDERIDEMIEELGAELGKKAVAEQLKKSLEEGWQRTNTYGESVGARISLKDRVSELLVQPTSYGSSRKWLDEQVTEQVQKVLREHFDAELKAAKAKFAKMVDDAVMGSWLKSVKEALGVR